MLNELVDGVLGQTGLVVVEIVANLSEGSACRVELVVVTSTKKTIA